MIASVPFRFNADDHKYVDLATGAVLPHITGLLKLAGLVDDTWFTEESSIRGTAVHKLTADYDLGALEPDSCVSRHRAYLLAHVKAMQLIQAEVLTVEEPLVYPGPKPWGGRIDRIVRIRGRIAVLEIKTTAAAHRSHEIQTALQAILADANDQTERVPAEMVQRLALYLKPSGAFKLVEHTRAHDFTEARRILREHC